MKTLILVRHAKSSWANFNETDFERPLNERGLRDAPDMALRLKERIANIDLFMSSPAKRAKTTCGIFVSVFEQSENKMLLEPSLYLAPVAAFYQVVSKFKNEQDTVAVFSHNPGISEFANTLCASQKINDMPTCGIFAVQANIDDWATFATAEKQFLFFKYPKQQD